MNLDPLCEWCGEQFVERRFGQKYCSKACRKHAGNDRQKHPPVAKTCPHCGGQFVTRKANGKKYCSPACQRASATAWQNFLKGEELRLARAGRTCAECGATFDASRSNQKYCGPRCRHRAWDRARDRRRRAAAK